MTRWYLIAPRCSGVTEPSPLLRHECDIRPYHLAIRAQIGAAPNAVLIQLGRFLPVQLRPRQSSPADSSSLQRIKCFYYPSFYQVNKCFSIFPTRIFLSVSTVQFTRPRRRSFSFFLRRKVVTFVFLVQLLSLYFWWQCLP